MKTALKPCPFCAGTSLSVIFADLSARVSCLHCGAKGPERQAKQTLAQAEQAWNQRAAEIKAH